MDVFQLVGKIIIDGKDQFEDTVSGMSKAADKLGNGLKKIASVAVATATAAGAAVVAIGKQSLDAYADYEQLFGGVKAMFDNNAAAQEKVVGTAKKAWKDLTMSQNEYYKSFMSSYPLIKASIEDENTAIETTNRLLTLEADLANTFGGDVSNYANAINWALKGTYSYLDNLNIGISGTAEGFLEAANNSGLFDKKLASLDELTSDQKLAVLEHYADQYGVLGRTADEAAGTIQGSTLMMKAAWENLLVGFADETQDVSILVGELLTSCVTAAENIVPRLVQIFQGILASIPEVTAQVKEYLFEMFPGLEEKVNALKGYFEDIGLHISTTLAPILGDLQIAFTNVKDAVEPFVEQLIEYVTSGELATDASNMLKDAVTFIAEAYQSAKDFINDTVIAFQDACTWVEQHRLGLEILTSVIGVLTTAIVAFNVAQAIANAGGIAMIALNASTTVGYYALVAAETVATAATTAFGAAMAFLTSPVTLVVAAIAAIIAIIVLCVQHWDEIKAKAIEVASAISEKWQEIKENVSNYVTEMLTSVGNKFNEIKSTIQEKIEAARDVVKNAIEKIRSFFDFSWELPKLKMPHFTVSGSFSLNPLSVPSFGISWYKKAYDDAMVLNDPTIFGFSAASGKMLGGGEGNGNEVVAGEAHLMNLISEAVAAQNETMVYYMQSLVEMLAEYFPQVIEAAGHDIVTNDGVIVARYAPMFNTALGKISRGKDRGR